MERFLKIKDIPANRSIYLTGELSLQELVRLQECVSDEQPNLEFQITLQRHGLTLDVAGQLQGIIFIPCSRCLNNLRYSILEPFHITLLPQGQQSLEPEIALSEDDLDTDYYHNDEIDLVELLEEQILLAVPIRIVCEDILSGQSCDLAYPSKDHVFPEENPFTTFVHATSQDV